MDSQYKLLSELLSDQAAFIASPKTSLANYWGGIAPLPPVSTGLYTVLSTLMAMAYLRTELPNDSKEKLIPEVLPNRAAITN